ncbi:lamin tail domain-containing protein [Candidatus Saccharibacteria bacterium]|nr:lamin tail domain-containing protein [Candidatus Saccharibacteria bacterium]
MRFYAVNAGYKDDFSAQNYDFIELVRPDTVEPHSLTPYKIVYTNSNGNPAGEITFGAYDYLVADHLVLGFKASPQYQDAPAEFLYNFGTAGLASTAGMLQLYHDNELIDELCWGKLSCAQQFAKFSTTESSNTSIILCDPAEDCDSEYYAELDPDAIVERPPDLPAAISAAPSCAGVQITEIYSYYQEDSSEQFVELHNPTPHTLPLDGCQLAFKSKTFPLDGVLSPGQYYAFQDDNLTLTKSPIKALEIKVIDAAEQTVTTASYDKKQKRGASYAAFGADG